MPKRKIILHVGQSKAGSTSIQNYLEQQSAQLAARGVLFPTSVLSRHNAFDRERTSGHRQLLADIKSGDVHAFEAEVAEHQPHTIILSIEGLFSDLPVETLQSLREYLRDDEIELIAVLRPQLDWLRSRYVEDVMTGFKSAFTEPFTAFAHSALDTEALSYRRRLKALSETFDAAKTTAIAMVRRDQSLVQLFVEAAGLPVSDVELARKIHSNHRDKHVAVIEAKRRLNVMTGALETGERLELEHALRERAAETLSDHGAMKWRAPFEEPELDSLREGNLALHRDGVLDAPLPIGEPEGSCERLPEKARADMERLFAYGSTKAAEIAARARDRAIEHGSPMSFSPEEAEALTRPMRESRVSLHLNAEATALMAACFDGGLVNLLLYTSSRSYRRIAELDRLHTASPLTAVSMRSDEVSHLTRCVEKLGLVAPELIVAGGATTARPVKLAVEQIEPRTLLLLDDAVKHAADLPLRNYDAQSVGRLMILRRRRSD